MTDKDREMATLTADLVVQKMEDKFVLKDVCQERHSGTVILWTIALGSYGFTLLGLWFLIDKFLSGGAQ